MQCLFASKEEVHTPESSKNDAAYSTCSTEFTYQREGFFLTLTDISVYLYRSICRGVAACLLQ